MFDPSYNEELKRVEALKKERALKNPSGTSAPEKFVTFKNNLNGQPNFESIEGRGTGPSKVLPSKPNKPISSKLTPDRAKKRKAANKSKRLNRRKKKKK